jgi:hypothetical protein
MWIKVMFCVNNLPEFNFASQNNQENETIPSGLIRPFLVTSFDSSQLMKIRSLF